MRGAERLQPFVLFLAAACSIASGERSVRAAPASAEVVEFNRDIRPIVADNCFACHGPDKSQRKASLRLDSEEEALADRGGYQAIAPGRPEKSELVRRITAEDVKERMPPAKSGKKLTQPQIELLRRWIEQGSKWQKHWSLIPPRRPQLPPQQLPRHPVRQLVHEADLGGGLVAGQARRRELDHVPIGQRHARLQDDERLHRLARQRLRSRCL